MTNFKVYLDPKSSPAVTVKPKSVDVPRGDHTINWTRGKGQSFDFVDLNIPSKRSCFGTPSIKPEKVSVTDKHTGTPATTGKFRFDLVVSNGGKRYTSRAPAQATRSSVGAMSFSVGGDPTIRNT